MTVVAGRQRHGPHDTTSRGDCVFTHQLLSTTSMEDYSFTSQETHTLASQEDPLRTNPGGLPAGGVPFNRLISQKGSTDLEPSLSFPRVPVPPSTSCGGGVMGHHHQQQPGHRHVVASIKSSSSMARETVEAIMQVSGALKRGGQSSGSWCWG